jgi:hypothetical protein
MALQGGCGIETDEDGVTAHDPDVGDASSRERRTGADEGVQGRRQNRHVGDNEPALPLTKQEACAVVAVAVGDEALVDCGRKAEDLTNDGGRLGGAQVWAVPQARRARAEGLEALRRRARLHAATGREGTVAVAWGVGCFAVAHEVEIHGRSVPTMTLDDNRPDDDGDDPLAAFPLFCAYHLGLDRFGRRRFNTIHDVARAAGVDRDTVDAALGRHGLDAASMLRRDFDLASAQLDIQASPPGVDLVSIALMHWELFCAAPEVERDWAREAEDDARENDRTFKRQR